MDALPQAWLAGKTVPQGLAIFHDLLTRSTKRIEEDKDNKDRYGLISSHCILINLLLQREITRESSAVNLATE